MAFTFKFADKFPTLTQPDFDSAYDDINVQYAGVLSLWATSADKDSKRLLLQNYLVAWYLANKDPDSLVGVVNDGGKPLLSKKMDESSVVFKDLKVQPGMEVLTTNWFGLQALQMIQGAPERYMVR